MSELINSLISQGHLKSPEIIKAFRDIKRRDFLLEKDQEQENLDAPIPIGQGQTNSQPFTVALMLELLQPKKGQKILDVGSGSGWTTALLANIVGEQGHVFAVELVPKLKEFGEKNVAKYGFKNITYINGDGTKGLPDQAPFDRINVAAAASDIPQALKDQLAVGGKMIIPTQQNDLRLVEKIGENEFTEEIFEGFVFVPLIVKK